MILFYFNKNNDNDDFNFLRQTLKDKAPKSDEAPLRDMMNDLKNKWTAVCAKSVDRQRKLEEALLFSGQFKGK